MHPGSHATGILPQVSEQLRRTLLLQGTKVKKKVKDDDITELSSTLSLKCPLSIQRIEVPCRSSKCTHLQCFDAYTFLSINQRIHRWICPVCNRKMDSWEELIVDGYYTDILESTPKSLENVNVSPDGKWEVPAARVPFDIDSPVPMLSDSESSSSGTKSRGNDKGPIYVIDDDDEEESLDGSSSSYDNEMTGLTRVDSSMEVEEVGTRKPGPKEKSTQAGQHEGSAQPRNSSQQPTMTTTLPTMAPSRSESSVVPRPNSQPVPQEHQFMDLTLYPSTDVIDLTTDSEDEDRDQTLVLDRRKGATVQLINGVRNSNINTRNVKKNGAANNSVASTAVPNNHTNNNSNRISIESLLGSNSCAEPSDASMEDTFESGRVPPRYVLSSNSRQQLVNYSSNLTGSFHSIFSPALSLPTPGPTLLESYPTCVRFSPSSDGDVVSLQFDPPLYTTNTWDGATTNGISADSMGMGAGVDGNKEDFDSSFWPAVSESAIPPWSTFEAAYASPFLSQSLGVFGERSQDEEVGGLQAGLLTSDPGRGGVGLGTNGQQGERDDEEEVGERPNKRPHMSRSYSPKSPELDSASADRVQVAIEQYLSSQNLAV
ncbi:SUMO ligase siz1 [Mortierella sp. 14UC]|nr:SUMO ligase siz1 [Mortierella sp. 14UC]